MIKADGVYTLKEFSEATGIKPRSIWPLRRKGLKTHYVHERMLIYGQDFMDYLKATERNQ